MRCCILAAPHYTTALLYSRITHQKKQVRPQRESVVKAGLVDAAGKGNYEKVLGTVACERRLEAKGLPCAKRKARDAGRVLST